MLIKMPLKSLVMNKKLKLNYILSNFKTQDLKIFDTTLYISIVTSYFTLGLHDIVRLILILYSLASIFQTIIDTIFIYSGVKNLVFS